MHLIFNATRLPYAEYATYLLGASKSANLVLAFTPNALNTLLLIDKSRLKGKVSIMRYFSRLFNLPIYESRSPSSTASIDKYLDNFNKSCLEDIESGSKFYLCDSFSLADILLWDYCKSVPSSSLSSLVLKYLQDLEKAHPILIDAASEINSCLANSSVMDLFKAKIALKVSELFPDVLSPESTLVLPKDHKKTDLALPVAKLRLPGNPIEIAKNMASKFDKSDYIEGCEAVGPYVNFTFNKQLFASLLIPQIIRLDKAYGSNFQGAGKTAIIEFSSPNIAKPFHAGHLRSTIIGNFITNVLKFTGWKTHSINYLGDWGKQYGLLALGYQRYGDRKSLENDPIKHLFDVYVKINVFSVNKGCWRRIK